MKKIILSIIVSLVLASCSDFLEEKSVTVLTQDYYKSPEGLEVLTKTCYQILRYKPDYNQGHYIFGIGTDVEAFSWSNAERIDMGSYSASGFAATTSTNRYGALLGSLVGQVSGGAAEGVYPEVNRCNIFLENYQKLTAAQQQSLAARKGEILFLRSYSYFLMTNVFGNSPLILKSFSELPDNFNFPKVPMADIYKQIIADMRVAVDLLPNTTTEAGRITKPAAAHFLAKLYLTRAQGADFENSSEPTLKALFKGKITTDLDSAIHYSTVAIDICKPNNAAYGGLSTDYGALWKNTTGDYSRETQKEILLAAQYESTQTYNGRYGNNLVHLFNSNHTTLRAATTRVLDYGRPYATAGATDWGYDMFTDRANDSRYYKTYLTDYVATATTGSKNWDKINVAYYNKYLKPAGAANAVKDKPMITALGARSIVYIENSKDQPLDSLWVVSQPFIMMVRWMVGSPDNKGYYDAAGNEIAGAIVDPATPYVTNKGTRKLLYRVSGDKGDKFGIDTGTATAQWYMGPRKWLDINRGKGTDPNGSGAIDFTIFRLAETYLIRAEAYGRKGNMTAAIDDINVLRKRAAYHANELRSDVLVKLEPAVLSGKLVIPAAEKVAPYKVVTDSYDKIKVTGDEWTPGTDKFKLENYPAGVNNYFVQFIYNEKAREMAFEMNTWEDLHNAGILYERIRDRDMMGAPATSTGTADFPFPKDDVSTGNIGALGKGKGNLQRFHTFKPWPQSYLDALTDDNNNPLTTEAKQAYQNLGY